MTGAVASERVSEALKGSLRMVGNHSKDVYKRQDRNSICYHNTDCDCYAEGGKGMAEMASLLFLQFRDFQMCIRDRDYPLYYDAVNEKGLGMAGLNFAGNAVYCKPKEGRDNIAPVSYTHLDVYKRQV